MDKEKKLDLITEQLKRYDPYVLETALAYAYNLYKYGVDVRKEWETATHQAYSLSQAYRKGFADAKEQCRNACRSCKSRNDKPFQQETVSQ